MIPTWFISKLNIVQSTKCWEWTASRDKHGYGLTKYPAPHPRKTRHAHRVAWELHYGLIPDGLCVLHKCDNPRCCNPEHLFIGTNKDNTTDMMIKGRHWVHAGEKHKSAKLSDVQVKEIREILQGGPTNQTELAKRYGVKQCTISRIRHGHRRVSVTR